MNSKQIAVEVEAPVEIVPQLNGIILYRGNGAAFRVGGRPVTFTSTVRMTEMEASAILHSKVAHEKARNVERRKEFADRGHGGLVRITGADQLALDNFKRGLRR